MTREAKHERTGTTCREAGRPGAGRRRALSPVATAAAALLAGAVPAADTARAQAPPADSSRAQVRAAGSARAQARAADGTCADAPARSDVARTEVPARPDGSRGDTVGVVWFPDRTSFDPLLAAPREVALRGGFDLVDREEAPDDFRGTNVEADVALGHRLGVVRLQREGRRRPELTLGLEVGVFTRFFMQTPEKDLINADFRVGAPLSARWREWEGRLTLMHVSSHFGDDFVNRFDPPPRQVTRDGFELLVGRRLGRGVRLYAGGAWNFHVNPGVERTAARAGVEWDPAPGGAGSPGVGRAPTSPPGGPGAEPASAAAAGGEPASAAGTAGRAPRDRGFAAWPFAAADARITSVTEEVAAQGIGGVALRVEGVVLRLEARGHLGPSPLGQLRTRDEASAGVGLRVQP